MVLGITKTNGVLGGKARLKNHRISVVDIVEMVENGYSRDAVAEELRIEPLEVDTALRHYRLHKEAIDKQLRERERLHQELSEQSACAP